MKLEGNKFKKIAVFMFVNTLIGNVVSTIIDYHYWLYPKDILYNSIYSLFLGSALWLGNEYLYGKISKKYSWLQNPLKTLIVAIFTSFAYSFLAFILINYFWLIVFLGKSTSVFWSFTSHTYGYLMASFLFVSIVIHAITFYKKWKLSVINQEKLRRERLALQFDTLKNQVNPHFLFNSLNVLTSLIYNDPDKAIAAIDQLMKVYQYVLNQKDKELVPLCEEITFVENYIFMQKIRFDENLIVKIHVPQSEPGLIIPLSLQMLVENAIKHNVISADKPLCIEVSSENDYLIIKNSLQKKQVIKNSSKIGLTNIKARYEYLTNKLFIVEEINNMFVVKLPLLFAEK
jgi:two-component system LytT family sensor kinase